MNGTTITDEGGISPEHGRRLINVELDRIANTDPGRPFLARPRNPTDLSAGFEDISYHRISNAVNRTAHWLEKELGKPRDFDTIAYLAPPDVRNILLTFAVCKVGFKLLLLSPRNSLQGNVNLFNLTRCETIIVTDPPAPFAQGLLAQHSMNTIYIPSLSQLLAEDEVPPYPFTKSFDEAKNDPVLVLHTSGSTGFPKPITWTHGFFAAVDNMVHKIPPLGMKSAVSLMRDARLFNTMPGFHAGGIGTMTYYAIWLNCCPVLLPPSQKPLDGATVASALSYANVSSILVVPSVLEDMSNDPVLTDALSNVKNVMYSGGALPKDVGEKLKHRAHLQSYLGSTEFAIFPHLIVENPDDWQYLAVDPCGNVNFRPHTESLYEAVTVRSKECEMYQPVWHIFPDLQEYHTRDLFSKHPTKSGLWMYQGRMDDIIVFVNGEKLNPVTFEDQVGQHALVNSVLVAGEGRFQAALLMEPIQPLYTTAEKARFLQTVWPLIEKANEASPAHGRIAKTHILFTTPGKPMLRAGKGTIQRRQTLAAYASEIDALYADADSFINGELTQPISEPEASSLESFVLRIVKILTGHDKEIGPDDDLFSQKGMDSLQVLQLVRELRSHGYSKKDKYNTLSPSIVYNNPTASSLAVAIRQLSLAHDERIALSSSAKVKEMQSLLVRFSGPSNQMPSEQPEVVMLTGSTGALGSYILDSLLKSPKVKKIYCLDRAASAERQAEINKSRGLSTNLDSSKVEFFKADFTAVSPGLDETIFGQIFTTVTKVIHCAWPVDFNLSLQSFSPQLQAIRYLLDFAAVPNYPKSIFFISSIASVGNWSSPEPVPERPFSDFSLPSSTGYAESKFLAEQLLLGSASLVDVSVCRVGQIAGPALSNKGVWKKNEWLPSLIKSSKYLKLLPETLGASVSGIDWVPVDVLATALVELALLPPEESAKVYHAVNPQSCTWKSLLPTVRDLLDVGDVRIVPFGEWVAGLRNSAPQTFKKQDFEENPAIKILDFFEGLPGMEMPKLSTVETQKRSKVLREMKAVGPEDMQRWMQQWGFGLSNGS